MDERVFGQRASPRSATTAKPLPMSPARAASMAALRGQQVGLFGNGADHIEDPADIGAALGDLGDRLIGLMRIADQGMDLVAGIAQGLLGGADVWWVAASDSCAACSA